VHIHYAATVELVVPAGAESPLCEIAAAALNVARDELGVTPEGPVWLQQVLPPIWCLECRSEA